MARYAALLRGVNVGGHRKLPMAELRALLATLGASKVATYLQSGNVVFDHGEADREALAALLERGIHQACGFEVPVILRTAKELARVVARNPFPEVAATPTLLHVSFSAQPLPPKALGPEDAARFAPDQFRLDGAHVYLWYPNGAGRTKLTNDVIERRTGQRATARNWNTVLALQELLAD